VEISDLGYERKVIEKTGFKNVASANEIAHLELNPPFSFMIGC